MSDPNRKVIYLDDAIDAVNELTKWYLETYHETRPTTAAVIDRLMELPSAQPKRKTGRWERHNTYRGDDTSGYIDPDWRCSECSRQANVNEWFMYDLTDFCPNCGADMRGEQDE